MANSSLERNLRDRDLSFDIEKEQEFNKVLKGLKGNYFKFMQGQQEKYWQWHARMAEQYQLKELEAAVKATEAGTKEREKAEAEYNQRRLTVERKTVAIIASIEAEGWRSNYGKRRRELQETRQKEIDLARETAKQELQATIEKYAGQKDATDKIHEAEHKYREQIREALEKEWQLKKDQAADEEELQAKLFKKKQNFLSKYEDATKESNKQVEEELKKFRDMQDSGAYTDAEMEAQIKRVNDAQKAADAAAAQEESMKKLVNTIDNLASKAASFVADAFHDAENIMTTYQSHMNARLQGSATNFQEALDMVVNNTTTSIFVQSKEVLENMKKLSDEGVAYNLEQRAFLGTISDKIANTFDAFDSNLARLIRLQQADTTAARLGMEASLTKLFNSMFQDTSYLTTLSDSVSAAMIDAQALMEKNAAAEFDYVVQKWMGSLYSLGISDQAITSLAQGLNMLGTGDVQGLASNSSLQTLLAMSASNAGLDYSQLLLEGLSASSTNKLLESMVSYLKTIAEGSENQVVRAAYGNIFNMSQSDFAALSNLTTNDINTISSTMLSYTSMERELNNQFAQLITRMNISEMLSNVTSNAVFGLGKSMVENPVLYATNKMLDALDTLGLEMNIPAFTTLVMGTGGGLDLNTTVNDLMRLGVGGLGAMGMIGSILSSIGSAGGLNLESWGGTEYTTRGSGLGLLMSSMIGGTSGTAYVTTSNSGAMRDSALTTAVSDAEETKKITSKNTAKSEVTFDDFYKATVGEESSSYIRVQDSFLYDMWGRVIDDTLAEVKVHDSSLISVFENPLDVDIAHVLVEDGALLVKVKNTEDLKSRMISSVGINGTPQSLDEATLVNAIKKAFSEEGSETLINLFTEIFANTGFLIKGYPGSTIPVSVEQVSHKVNLSTKW